jgi:hypothetical protein
MARSTALRLASTSAPLMMYVRLVWLLYPKTFGASSMQRACPAQRDILIFTFMFHLFNSGHSELPAAPKFASQQRRVEFISNNRQPLDTPIG